LELALNCPNYLSFNSTNRGPKWAISLNTGRSPQLKKLSRRDSFFNWCHDERWTLTRWWVTLILKMNHKDLLKIFETEIIEALKHLVYSDKKIQPLPSDPALLNEETLETWESYAARFARVTDIFLAKYLRTAALINDPAFRGELRDFVDKAEKSGLISSSDRWMEIRELRNKIAHEYSRTELKLTFEAVKKNAPFVISELKRLFP
jgi:hypothetical protein